VTIEVHATHGIYNQLGLTPILNVAGTHTKLGGPVMNEDAARAMLDASRDAVPLDQLQAHASRIIAQITGAEAGYVTSGAAAGLTLATAACMCGLDIGRIDRLPDTRGMPCEVIIAREHRSGYDHAFRAAGAHLVEVGMNEITAGAGVRRAEPWEYEAMITAETVAVAYVYNATSAPRLEDVAEICRRNGVPLIVDAAGQVPPVENFRRLLAAGADVVVFSGGKGIRGPQGTGIVAGSRELIMSIALQHLDLDEHWDLWNPPESLIEKSKLLGLPRHGVGRGFKVAKEEIVGVLVALQHLNDGGDAERIRESERMLREVADAVASIPGITSTMNVFDGTYPTLDIYIGEPRALMARDVSRELRASETPIYIGEKRLDDNVLSIHPISLDDEKTTYLIGRLREVLSE
jgi:L-seryl-tRNA(Ser) seleniumtransferase